MNRYVIIFLDWNDNKVKSKRTWIYYPNQKWAVTFGVDGTHEQVLYTFKIKHK